MIRFKHGQSFSDLTDTMKIAVMITADIVEWMGQNDLVITWTTQGKHMKGSLHPAGQAVDIRSRTWDDPDAIAGAVRTVLGPDYDVIVEDDHLHIEYDPK